MNTPAQARAKALLSHYFRSLVELQGKRWGRKNQEEIEELVDLVFAAQDDDDTLPAYDDERRESWGMVRDERR